MTIFAFNSGHFYHQLCPRLAGERRKLFWHVFDFLSLGYWDPGRS